MYEVKQLQITPFNPHSNSMHEMFKKPLHTCRKSVHNGTSSAQKRKYSELYICMGSLKGDKPVSLMINKLCNKFNTFNLKILLCECILQHPFLRKFLST